MVTSIGWQQTEAYSEPPEAPSEYEELPSRLDEKSFILYAAKHYDNPQCCDEDEFYDDLKRFKYLKKCFTKYATFGEIKERLALNHIVILCNLFGPRAAVRMLFLKISPEHYPILIPFLVFLKILPQVVRNIGKNELDIKTDEIGLDAGIIDRLRKI